jgi:hypothetical protein
MSARKSLLILIASLLFVSTAGCSSEAIKDVPLVIDNRVELPKAAYLQGTGFDVDVIDAIMALNGDIQVLGKEPSGKTPPYDSVAGYVVSVNNKNVLVGSQTLKARFQGNYDGFVSSYSKRINGVLVVNGSDFQKVVSELFPSGQVFVKDGKVHIVTGNQ